MWSVSYFWLAETKIGICGQVIAKIPNMKITRKSDVLV
jgi:hypothetical protein